MVTIIINKYHNSVKSIQIEERVNKEEKKEYHDRDEQENSF